MLNRAGTRLAMFGGARTVPKGHRIPAWPEVTPADEAAVLRALHSGAFTAAAAGETEIGGLERAWAAFVGTRECVAVSNGTAALSLALAAAGIQPDDEVIVPALSFIASAVAPLHIGAVPVFVDIDPVSFNLDPAAVAAAITPRTAAIVVVHLHGLPADMDEILELARARGIAIVEDAAQAHGAVYRGRRAGSIGLAGAFSLNVSKNLATCGEGGLVNTDDTQVHRKALAMRQFGEVVEPRTARTYVSHMLGWNHKPNAIQCAFARSQLDRLPAGIEGRDRSVRAFLARVSGLPGLVGPTVPEDRTHAWHILRFRVDPAAFGLPPEMAGRIRAAVMRALRAEGVPAASYQLMPLPAQPMFGKTRGLAGDYPVTSQVIEDSFVLQKAHLHPDAGELLNLYAEAMAKVLDARDLLAGYAATMPYRAPWEL
ncbi:MAG: DegT/DnrJ/EryC1/StrS family aminotransferase [Micromonosporaceae bacterium]